MEAYTPKDFLIKILHYSERHSASTLSWHLAISRPPAQKLRNERIHTKGPLSLLFFPQALTRLTLRLETCIQLHTDETRLLYSCRDEEFGKKEVGEKVKSASVFSPNVALDPHQYSSEEGV